MLVDIIGRRAIARAFKTLPKQVAKKVVRQGLRKGAKYLKAAVILNAPHRTGATEHAVRVAAAKRSRGALGVDVKIGEGDFLGKTFAAAFVEYGSEERRTKAGHYRGKVVARRFMFRAQESAGPTARRLAQAEIGRGILREARALAAKGTPKRP